MKDKTQEFWTRWNFPNCIGAIDGKHIRMKCPKNTGSLYFNNKEHFSLVLLALVDANCKFLVIDVMAKKEIVAYLENQKWDTKFILEILIFRATKNYQALIILHQLLLLVIKHLDFTGIS